MDPAIPTQAAHVHEAAPGGRSSCGAHRSQVLVELFQNQGQRAAEGGRIRGVRLHRLLKRLVILRWREQGSGRFNAME